jgi:zinc protease
MRRFNSTVHQKTMLVVSIALLGISQISIANDGESHQAAPSNAPITALPYLSSLRNIQGNSLKTPKVESFSTKNGTPVLFVAANELPMMDIKLTFDAGSARDSEIREGLFGLASLTSQLLDEGTSTQSTDDIATNFERLGAAYSAASYRDMFTVSLRSLSDSAHFNPSLDQLLNILKDAQFPQSSIDRITQNAAIGQQQRKESPSATVGIRFNRELYGKHPYAEPSTGTESSLKKIKPEDIRKFKDTFLVANNLNIAITGQLNVEQAKQMAERITQSLPQGQKARPLPLPTALASNKIVPVKFNSTQSHVMIGQVGISRDNPDLITLTVGNEILGGGGFNALLMKELREKRGLTYGAYSGFTAMRSNGPFTISYSTRADQTVTSIQVAKQTLKDFLSAPINPEILAETKEGLLKSYPLSLASNDSINSYLSMMGFYNLPVSYLADYPKKIEAVTAEQIQQAMQRYIQPEKMLTVVVGQAFDSSQISQPIAPATAASQPESSTNPNQSLNDAQATGEATTTVVNDQASPENPTPVVDGQVNTTVQP